MGDAPTVLEPTAGEISWARRAARHIARRLADDARGVLDPAGARFVAVPAPFLIATPGAPTSFAEAFGGAAVEAVRHG
jgi:hypothetical protein